MSRRTVHLPDGVDALVRQMAREGESFSATVTRLIEAGAGALHGRRAPSYVAAGEGPEDLGRRAEDYLREAVRSS